MRDLALKFIIHFFSLRELLTAMGKPDERLTDQEVSR